MIKVKLLIVAGFLLAFGAGLVVGLWGHRVGASASVAGTTVGGAVVPSDGGAAAGEDRSRRGPRLTRELNLTPRQAEQMRVIWSEAMANVGHDQEDHRRALRQERDAAVVALLSGDQKAAYEKVMQEYTQKTAQLGEQRSKSFQAAVERSKQVLSEEQRKKYEELLKRREAEWRGGSGGRGGYRSGERGSTRPSTTRAAVAE